MMVTTVLGSPAAAIALVGWFPMVFLLFSVLPPRRAVIAAFLFAWMFLPVASYAIAFFPDYDKTTATCVSVLCAMFVFDTARVMGFRPKWYDLPMAVFCVCPVASSLTNGLGAYDGFSGALATITRWGIPYFVGRVYLNNLEGLRELAIGVFISGLVYVPLCLFEIRMSSGGSKL